MPDPGFTAIVRAVIDRSEYHDVRSYAHPDARPVKGLEEREIVLDLTGEPDCDLNQIRGRLVRVTLLP